MIPLITLEEVKQHLHRTDTRSDTDLETKIMHASAIVLNYLKIDDLSPMSFPWPGGDQDIPFDVQAACFLVIGRLNQDREGNDQILTNGIKSLLHRWRTPAMA
jgi:hypothetical protein